MNPWKEVIENEVIKEWTSTVMRDHAAGVTITWEGTYWVREDVREDVRMWMKDCKGVREQVSLW